jgi:hypothetical protein
MFALRVDLEFPSSSDCSCYCERTYWWLYCTPGFNYGHQRERFIFSGHTSAVTDSAEEKKNNCVLCIDVSLFINLRDEKGRRKKKSE